MCNTQNGERERGRKRLKTALMAVLLGESQFCLIGTAECCLSDGFLRQHSICLNWHCRPNGMHAHVLEVPFQKFHWIDFRSLVATEFQLIESWIKTVCMCACVSELNIQNTVHKHICYNQKLVARAIELILYLIVHSLRSADCDHYRNVFVSQWTCDEHLARNTNLE